MKRIIASFIISLALISPVFAQTPTGTARDIYKTTRQNISGEIQQIKAQFEQSRLQAKQAYQQNKEQFQQAVAQKRATLQNLIQTKRAQLKAGLAKIKDERKRNLVERIDSQLDKLNENRLNHYSQVLEKLEKILENIQSRASKVEANGRDVSSVKTAISDASTAIAASRSAIAVQAGKTYKITVTTENNLKIDVGKTRQSLRADLVKVQDTVQKAREAVRKAATALAQIPKVDDFDVPTTTITVPASTSSQ